MLFGYMAVLMTKAAKTSRNNILMKERWSTCEQLEGKAHSFYSNSWLQTEPILRQHICFYWTKTNTNDDITLGLGLAFKLVLCGAGESESFSESDSESEELSADELLALAPESLKYTRNPSQIYNYNRTRFFHADQVQEFLISIKHIQIPLGVRVIIHFICITSETLEEF